MIRPERPPARPIPGLVHYAGIVVVVRPGDLERVAEALDALAGVEVYHRDPEGGRLVVVQEAGSARDQEEGFRRIEALSGVVTAALVEHRIDRPADAEVEPMGTIDSSGAEAAGRER